MKTRKPLAYISLLLGVSFVPVKEEMIERGRYVVVNEFVERYYIVRTLEGKQVSYIHFESNEKIEKNDEIIIERVALKSLIGFKYEKLRINTRKNLEHFV